MPIGHTDRQPGVGETLDWEKDDRALFRIMNQLVLLSLKVGGKNTVAGPDKEVTFPSAIKSFAASKGLNVVVFHHNPVFLSSLPVCCVRIVEMAVHPIPITPKSASQQYIHLMPLQTVCHGLVIYS